MDETNNPLADVPEQISLFTEFIDGINWQAIILSVIFVLAKILLAVIIFFILKKIGAVVIETIFKRYMKQRNTVPNRLNTLHKLSKNSYNAILYFFLIYTILDLLTIPVGALVGSVGVVGLALSLGAQGFVSDVVNGFMILLEKQIDVGDVVELSGILGTVEDVNLKTTKIKDFDGTIHFVPNRTITVISNRSRADMRVMIHLRLFPSTDLHLVREILQKVNDEWIPVNEVITIEPKEIAFVPVGQGQLAAQVIMYTKAGSAF